LSGEQFFVAGVGVLVVTELLGLVLDPAELIELEVVFVDEEILVDKVEVKEEVELEDKLQLAPEEFKLVQVLGKSAALLNASDTLLKFVPLETLNLAVSA
jgi:hypothetical protein